MSADSGAPPDPVLLREELLTRARNDQAARDAHCAGATPWSIVEQIDTDNLAFLTTHLTRHGWLGSNLVGEQGAHACSLLVQHAPPRQQQAWLPLMHDAVLNGRADEGDLVHLRASVDRHTGGPRPAGA